MNVIVANKRQDLLNGLDIDIIKSISGEFSADELIQSFSNFFFNKMILDITAIKDYKDLRNIQKLSINLDMNKVILLLDDTDPACEAPAFLSKLISMGIYNFTKTKDGLLYLYSNPNSYKDVAHIHQLDQSNSNVMPNGGGNNYSNGNSGNSNSYVVTNTNSGCTIIGFKNVTSHAGATSLIYMLKKQLSLNYYVVAMEINRKDFMFFNEKDMISIGQNDINSMISKYRDADIILVDLNDIANDSFCRHVIYLVEPSTLKLNKLMMVNRSIFSKMSDKKLVLNKSLLTNKDVMDFEFEAGVGIFFNMPPMSDKKDNYNVLAPFIEKLGFSRGIEREDDGPKKFGLFKF